MCEAQIPTWNLGFVLLTSAWCGAEMRADSGRGYNGVKACAYYLFRMIWKVIDRILKMYETISQVAVHDIQH